MSRNRILSWWDNRVLRSVDNLKLWQENPRLDPTSKLITVRDFAEELIADSNDRDNFLEIVTSISSRGFTAFDPVVVWKDDKENFVVAEGNRRVLALKLLREPEKAPLSIRQKIVLLSRNIDRDSIEKIRVCLAPSYTDARWYILQRHSSSASSQVRWQRLQQQRFIIGVYDQVGKDIDRTIEETGFKKSAIIDAIRFVKIRDIATNDGVTQHLTDSERAQVNSHKISMTVLERWFGNSLVREAWHVKFNENGLKIEADMESFYLAYSKLIKLMFTKNNDLGFLVNTRTIDSNFQKIFDYLPKVKLKAEPNGNDSLDLTEEPIETVDQTSDSNESKIVDNDSPLHKSDNVDKAPPLKGNPRRNQLTDSYHTINTQSYKIKALFSELQRLPVKRYPNVVAASLRVFLELSVDNFIEEQTLKEEMAKQNKKAYHLVTLQEKISTLRGEFIRDRQALKVIDELLCKQNQHSLNTLNEYIHGNKVHKIEPQFLNGFWDMLTPLLFTLIELKES